MPKLSKEAYTVAWICALADSELRVSHALLDVSHETPDLALSEAFPYFYGTMNGHNVVMACLPSGDTGNSEAAAIASGLRSTFPNLRSTLLVGVGGGVPSDEHDIRLGDVVVGHPNAASNLAGVVRYDHGKAIDSGRFETMGTMDRPPRHLLAAVGMVRSAQLSNNKWLENLEYLERNSIISPAPRADQLYEADYPHVVGEQSCRKCSPESEIKRKKRDSDQPQIHYGTIASADQVMRDALKRDTIRRRHPDILCFEMEAGGVANVLPCLVVRGICDYSDSHKNKVWQPYAAAAAAALAKEVLRMLPGQIVADNIPEQPKPCQGEKVVNMLRHDPDNNFVGRKEVLDEITSKFRANRANIALWGLGGVGKSELAIHYAWQTFKEEQDVSVFWVHASSPDRLYGDFLRIAQKFRLPGHEDPQANHARITCDWLSGDESGKWLLVLDNADNSNFTRRQQSASPSGFTILQYLPQKRGGAVLITSRDRRAALDLVGNDSKSVIEVKEMVVDEAAELFQKKTQDRGFDLVETHQIASQLDCIPLAITQAAAYINQESRMTIPRYLERFNDIDQANSPSAICMNDFRRDLNVPNAVVKTWEISFARIKDQNQRAVDLLYTIAFFDKHDIPEMLLFELPKVSRDDINDAIATLSRFCFLRTMPDRIDEHLLFETHRLIQLATKAWMRGNRVTEQFALKAICMVNSKFGDGGIEDWHGCRLLEPHADSVSTHLRSWWDSRPAEQQSTDGASNDGFDQPNMHSLIHALVASKRVHADLSYKRSVYASQHGYFRKSIELARLAKRDSQQICPPWNRSSLACAAPLVRSCLACEDAELLAEALKVGEETVERYSIATRDEPNDVHLRTDSLAMRTHLAMVYQRQQRQQESMGILTAVVKELEGMSQAKFAEAEAHECLVMAMNELSLLLGDCGDWEKASEMQSMALERLRHACGESHPHTLNMKANLARSILQLGEVSKGTEMLEEVVIAKQQRLKGDHFETIASMTSLAKAYENQGRLQEASNLLGTALENSQSMLGDNHPATLQRMIAFADVLHKIRNLPAAIETAERYTALTQARLGQDHPESIAGARLCRRWRVERELYEAHYVEIMARLRASLESLNLCARP